MSQEEWERMGFRGELQGTGVLANGIEQDQAGGAPEAGMKRSRSVFLPHTCRHLWR